VRKGAFNFLEKPFDLTHALLEVKRSIEYSELSRERDDLAGMVGGDTLSEFVGKSPSVIRLKETISMIAPKKVTVLLEGESGTGKEIVARAIHQLSGRKRFVAINCGAIPENLFESELFGYEKGAFTGALHSRPGLIEESSRGTLFLDEVSEMPPALQVKLLRVLETSTNQRLGGNVSRRLDLRVIAATNRDLESYVIGGQFRSDLYYRLNVVKLRIAPLREKREDIPVLVEYFLPRLCQELGLRKPPALSAGLLDEMMGYDWPGNIRELRNKLLSLLAVNGDREILSSIGLENPENEKCIEKAFEEVSLDEMEKRYISWLLKRHSGNKSETARILEISKSTLYEKIKRWESFECDNDTS
ncbi:MAG TPA: sigma-54 dependent transcriptional regulator, partial [Mesotoga infera]|nr:sigma-54 dependent transcriptional regulator [Mesotoga infera]